MIIGNKKSHAKINNKLCSVSVIVAIRNGEKTLPDLIKDLCAQDYSGDFEIILVDDHSNDNMFFVTGGYERLRIQSDGDIVATGNISSNNLPGRNLLINGAMRINQKESATHNSDG